MKKIATLLLTFFLLVSLTSCWKRGPFPVPLTQSVNEIVKIELVDGSSDIALLDKNNYAENVVYTLDPEEIGAFAEKLQDIDFFIPGYEPARHIGKVAVRIYYQNGNSDLLGSNCNYYIVGDFEETDRSIYYPDKEAFYLLLEQYVDSQLLPR